MDFLERVKGFLMEPSKTFDAVKDEPLEEAVKYYALIAVVYSVLLALMFAFAGSLMGSIMGFGSLGMMMGAGTGIRAAVILFDTLLVIMIAGAFIGGAILHIFVYIIGGRKSIVQTIKAVMYGSTPYLLLGWIPFIGFIIMIWSPVVGIIGIRQLQELTTGRAVLAFVLLIVVAFIIAIVFAAFIIRMVVDFLHLRIH